jgi:ribosomal protein L11 methyltransferase
MSAWPAIEIAFPRAAAAAASALSLQDRVLADLDGLEIVAIAEQPGDTWQVFFRTEAERAAALALLHAVRTPDVLGLRPINVDDGDWARRSQASLRAIRAGRIAVAPPWDAGAFAGDPSVITVVIEPAMGFGSGHHATTRLCLEALQRLDLRNLRVLDVGTGSGVLALAAARLGAAGVLAIDVDPDALDNARGNAELNGGAPHVDFRQVDFRQDAGLTAHVVVANLTGGMLEAGAADLARAVGADGALIVSGITSEEREPVFAAFAGSFRTEWQAEDEGWCCALLRRVQESAGSRVAASEPRTRAQRRA